MIIADLHTHTNVSHHAFCTIDEMCDQAKRMGHFAMAITNHAATIPDSAHDWHFLSLRVLPRVNQGVFLIRGAEVNVVDKRGTIDLNEYILRGLEFVIASMHEPCFKEPSPENCTNAWLGVLENPCVNLLGHMGNPYFKCDYKTVIKRCSETNKVVEINNNSMFVRQGSGENCLEIAKLCMEYGVPVMVNSDSHHKNTLGQVDLAMGILQGIGFPEQLIINKQKDTLIEYFKNTKNLHMEE